MIRTYFKKHFFVFSLVFILTSCGGGGSGPAIAKILSFASSVSSSLIGGTVNITWTSSESTGCVASGSWAGTKATSGSETVTISNTGVNEFTLTCNGVGGNAVANFTVEGYRNVSGVSVDGYISDATIFIDTNDDFTNNASENSTTSDSSGAFTIKHNNGVLISMGGKDIDTLVQLDVLMLTAPLNGYSDLNFSITPVTTIANFLPDENLYDLLGIDSSINFFTADPVASKGDGGAFDYLYEKGNQLTVIALSLFNISKDINSAESGDSTKDYFMAIAEEIKKENDTSGLKVNIENETFISNVIDNVILAKSLTISDGDKLNTVKALSNVMPLISVKTSDDLTSAMIRFSISTMQTDIVSIANGTADEALLDNYNNSILNYISTDQSVDRNELVTGILSVNDSIVLDEDTPKEFDALANDSVDVTGTINVTVTTPSNGTASVGSGGMITYSPSANFNGTDSFNYTISQGSESGTAMVSVTINPINDSPTIDSASTIAVNENTTSVGAISTSDVDTGDTLVLTIGGTDASSFELSATNNLTFISAPDFETKTSYSLTFSVTDGTLIATKDITINILNLNDVAPVITSATSFNIDENLTAIGTLTIVDPEGGSFTFTTGGTDGSLINVSSGGVLTFKDAPDYEVKTSYSFTVIVSDGVNTSSQTFSISINNLPELPTDGYKVPASIDVIETKE